MRLRVDVVTAAAEVPWPKVLAPGRGIAYDLLARAAPDLGRQLHGTGWGEHRMAPFGHGAPVFPNAPRRRGAYAAGGAGAVEFGSPLLAVVEAWARGLRRRELLDWGGVAMRITGVCLVEPPEFSSGHARLRTETPVVLKGSGRDGQENRSTRQAWLLPTEPEFPVYFQQNLRRKAETLGLSPEVKLDAVTWVGTKRSFAVGDGAKPGAPVEVDVSGEPATLQALWSWGLGQANSAGFGWVTG
jgi:CRISPR-associated endoribonuclease Cas6